MSSIPEHADMGATVFFTVSRSVDRRNVRPLASDDRAFREHWRAMVRKVSGSTNHIESTIPGQATYK